MGSDTQLLKQALNTSLLTFATETGVTDAILIPGPAKVFGMLFNVGNHGGTPLVEVRLQDDTTNKYLLGRYGNGAILKKIWAPAGILFDTNVRLFLNKFSTNRITLFYQDR